MSFKDLLQEYKDDPFKEGEVLKALDYMIKYIHDHGYYISDFDPDKIKLVNGKLTVDSFRDIIRRLEIDPRGRNINILQAAKIGLMAYNNMLLDGNMNQEHFNFIRDNFDKLNPNSIIPEDIHEYYGELFLRGMMDYMTSYIIRKEEEAKQNAGNTNHFRKSLSTEAGRALANNQFLNDDRKNAAYVDILFIPSILTLIYLIGLFIYTFLIK